MTAGDVDADNAAEAREILQKARRRVSVLAGIGVLTVVSAATRWPVVQESPVDRLGWLAGCWIVQSARGGPIIEEQWLRPRGGMMLGASRTVQEGRVVEYETLRIHVQDGAVLYEAQPSGQAGASFRASTVSDTLVVFENPQHDFPQTIQYRRVGADSVSAWVGGTRGGQMRIARFPYARTSCS